MKYGELLEYESVPEWSLHNVDYNSLKREIKTHTLRDQATAIAIPGQEDRQLRKFEDGLYEELCRQHERVDLFVTSKADEVRRRLEHLAPRIELFARKCGSVGVSARSRRKFAKLERDLLRCGDDLAALKRFINAQTVAFRKILKKYRKWTGSATLGNHFRQDVLSQPKSFTKRSFSETQARYDNLKATLRAVGPDISEPSSPDSDQCPHDEEPNGGQPFTPLPPPHQGSYWNEYEYGSDSGGREDVYAIYIHPDDDDDDGFPGLGYVRAVISIPFAKARGWFSRSSKAPEGERDPLLPTTQPHIGYSTTASSMSAPHTESNSDEECSSGDDFPGGYLARYATLPSINDQKVERYRENVYFWGSVGCFATSFVLIVIASILLSAGRHKARLEVDAGVTVGIVTSVLASCGGLGMYLLRADYLSAWHRVAVWVVFLGTCLLDLMLLILVMEW